MADIQRYAIIIEGVVNNVCLWDGDETKWQPPQGSVTRALVNDEPVNPGHSWTAKGGFTPAPLSAVSKGNLDWLAER